MKAFFFLLMCASINSFSQSKSLVNKAALFITNALKTTEFNPTHYHETMYLYNAFCKAFKERNNPKNEYVYTHEIDTMFQLLYANAYNTYEDAPDIRRMKLRRAHCYAALALMAGEHKSKTFLEQAKLSLIEKIENPDMNLLEEPYLGLLFLEALINYENGYIDNDDLNHITKFLSIHKESISPQMYSKAKTIVNDFNAQIKETKN